MTRRGVALAVLALLGLALTAALTWSIGRITGQHIGLASAPPSVIRGLAPSSAAPAERHEPGPRHRVGDRPEPVIHRAGSTAAAARPTPRSAAVAAPASQPSAPAAPSTSTITATQASSPGTTSPPRTASASSGSDGRDGSGGSGVSGSGRDD